MKVIYPPGTNRQYDPYYPISLTLWFFAEPMFRRPPDPNDPFVSMMPANRSFWVSAKEITNARVETLGDAVRALVRQAFRGRPGS